MSKLRTGTCSWKYESWKGLVYSENSENMLAEYSTHYDTVEIDQWFWSLWKTGVILPKKQVVREYAASVPPDFKFSIKMPNSISLTHYYKNQFKNSPPNKFFLSSELTFEFFESIKDMGNLLGPLMLQFEYLNKQKISGQTEFMAMLMDYREKLPDEILWAIEIRNPNFLNREFFNFLNEHKFCYVFSHGYYMPDIAKVYEKFDDLISGTAIIRLLGPDRGAIEEKAGGNWNKVIEPKDDEISKIVEIINDMLSKETDVYLNVNNHFEGSAPLTIQKFQKLLDL